MAVEAAGLREPLGFEARGGGGGGGEGVLGGVEPRPDAKAIAKDVVKVALPCMMTYTLELINEFTNTTYIGHYGNSAELAAVGLGNMMQNCIGLSVGFGVVGVLDTLVSQAFGAGRHQATAVYLQRCRIIVTLQLVWMIPLLWFSRELLVLMHQDEAVAQHAGEYNRASVWGLFAVFQFESAMKFLCNRQETLPPAVIGAMTSVFHIGWCSFFVAHLGLGNAGAGYANAVTWWTRFLLITLYLACSARRLGLSRRSLIWIEAAAWREWKAYGKLAAACVTQLCSEWWFWEICALIVGYLGETALAAHVSALNFVAIAFMPVIGLQSATATLAGNALGANLPRKAQKTVVICTCLDFCMWTVFASIIFSCRRLLALAYTSETAIQEVMEKLWAVFAIAGFGDSLQNIMGGALRGLGLQRFASITYLVNFYLVMLPLGVIAAFPLSLGVCGIWYSFVVGTAGAAIVFAVRLRTLDWPKLAQEACERMAAEERAAKAASDAQSSPSTMDLSLAGAAAP